MWSPLVQPIGEVLSFFFFVVFCKATTSVRNQGGTNKRRPGGIQSSQAIEATVG
jgi:hypothetical protein